MPSPFCARDAREGSWSSAFKARATAQALLQREEAATRCVPAPLILPLLASDAPRFAEDFLGTFTGAAVETNLGVLPTLWSVVGALYILGPLLFGVATLRAGVLSRWAAGLFGFGAVSSVAFGLLPSALEPLATVPMGLGLAWLGYSLWSERREPGAQGIRAERDAVEPTNTAVPAGPPVPA